CLDPGRARKKNHDPPRSRRRGDRVSAVRRSCPDHRRRPKQSTATVARHLVSSFLAECTTPQAWWDARHVDARDEFVNTNRSAFAANVAAHAARRQADAAPTANNREALPCVMALC